MDAVVCPDCRELHDALPTLTTQEFTAFRRYLHELAGLHLSDAKRCLISARLGGRLRRIGVHSFTDYLRLVRSADGVEERQHMVDALTTNETSFFREAKHFELLAGTILPKLPSGPVAAWSAACSSGEEVYSLAMVLAEARGIGGFSVLGTDISRRVLAQAQEGIYPAERAGRIPRPYLARYCLRGVRSQQGNVLIDRRLRERVTFRQLNLNGAWEQVPAFRLIFLRNVMIYFDADTRRRLIERIAGHLEPGGYLFVGHSETLNGMTDRFTTIVPSVYRLRLGR